MIINTQNLNQASAETNDDEENGVNEEMQHQPSHREQT